MKNKTIITLGICLSTLFMSCGTEHFGTSRAISADQNPFSNRNVSTGGSTTSNVSTVSSEISSPPTSGSGTVTTTPLTSGAFPATATTPGSTPARTNATPLTSGDSSGSNGNGTSTE